MTLARRKAQFLRFGDEILMQWATFGIFTFIETFTNSEAAAMYLNIYNTLTESNKRRQIEFYKEVKYEFRKQLYTKKKDSNEVEDQG